MLRDVRALGVVAHGGEPARAGRAAAARVRRGDPAHRAPVALRGPRRRSRSRFPAHCPRPPRAADRRGDDPYRNRRRRRPPTSRMHGRCGRQSSGLELHAGFAGSRASSSPNDGLLALEQHRSVRLFGLGRGGLVRDRHRRAISDAGDRLPARPVGTCLPRLAPDAERRVPASTALVSGVAGADPAARGAALRPPCSCRRAAPMRRRIILLWSRRVGFFIQARQHRFYMLSITCDRRTLPVLVAPLRESGISRQCKDPRAHPGRLSRASNCSRRGCLSALVIRSGFEFRAVPFERPARDSR